MTVYNAKIMAERTRNEIEDDRQIFRVSKKEFFTEIGHGREPDFLDEDVEIPVRLAPGYWDPHTRLVKATDKVFVDVWGSRATSLRGIILRQNGRNVYLLNLKRW